MNDFQESSLHGWVRRTFQLCDDVWLANTASAIFGILAMVAGVMGLSSWDRADYWAAFAQLLVAVVSFFVVVAVLAAMEWEYSYRNYLAIMAQLAADEADDAAEAQDAADQAFNEGHSDICQELKARFDDLTLDADTRETAIDGRSYLIDWHSASTADLDDALRELRGVSPDHEQVVLTQAELDESIALLNGLDRKE